MVLSLTHSRGWGRRSLIVYNELDPRLQAWCDRMLAEVCDISLIAGHRNKTDQNYMYDHGLSHLRWPNGKHNRIPSQAVDMQPYPRPVATPKLWAALGYMAGRGEDIAEGMGLTLRWGGDWDRDGDLTDQDFDDLFHWEL